LIDDVIRDLIQGYLTELSKTVGVYMDCASGEEQVDGKSIPLELFPAKSFETKCNEDSRAVQKDLTCPITLHIMQDPVKCSDGKTYERAAIEKQFLHNRTSPWTSAPLEPDDCDSSKPRCTPDEEILAKIIKFKEEKSKEEEKLKQDAEGEEENQIWRSRYGAKERTFAGEEQREKNSATCHFNSANGFLEFITNPNNAQRACLTGPPASGKTATMLQTVHAAVHQCRRKMQGGEPLVPVFMRASELSKLLTDGRAANKVQELLCVPDNKGDSLRRLVVLFFEGCVRQNRYPKLSGLVQGMVELFDLNLLLVCIDGLDEAAAHRELVENSIDQAVRSQARAPLRLLLSTRKHSYAHSRACFRLGEFGVVKLQPLTRERQMDMIRRRMLDFFPEAIAPEKVYTFKQKLDARVQRNPELATSPFLLNLMIEVYKKKGDLPSQRVELYKEQVQGIVSRCIEGRAENKQEESSVLDLEKSRSKDTVLQLAIEYLEVCSFVFLRCKKSLKIPGAHGTSGGPESCPWRK
jgi:hypothetical protein